MGLLSFFSKPARPLLQLHSGSFSLDRGGHVLATTLPSSFPPALILEIGSCVVEAFRGAQVAQLPLDELVVSSFSPTPMYRMGAPQTARRCASSRVVALSTSRSRSFCRPSVAHLEQHPTPGRKPGVTRFA